ncbi:MAG: tRNA guanosine(34) transglycosylase Tgt [Patescibacteria group bacterium]
MKKFGFEIEKKLEGTLARAGVISTPHGDIQTPAFVAVGTKATVKALSPEQVRAAGSQVVLSNTYHLYLEPGDEIVKNGGGLSKFMGWNGPTMTDSGGFQVFSLGAAFDSSVSKVSKNRQGAYELPALDAPKADERTPTLVEITEEGVKFKSYLDGSEHFFTPERSMEIQYNLGADIIFAFDECTSPDAGKEYQKQALDRTHRWAARSLEHHKYLKSQNSSTKSQINSKHQKSNSEVDWNLELGTWDFRSEQALFGIVQGARYEDLRKESAETIGAMDFDGFGIGGSFDKEDMGNAVKWVNEILPEGKPRHLLGIGEPIDLILGVENGIDTFDCVIPTRLGRNGTLYTKTGKINITKAEYRRDYSPIEEGCGCYACQNYTKAYLAHLFRSKEMFAGTLGSIHNLYFLTKLVADLRAAILDGLFFEYKKNFLGSYK